MARLLGILILVLGLYGVFFAVTRGGALSSDYLLPLTREQAFFAVLDRYTLRDVVTDRRQLVSLLRAPGGPSPV